LEAAIVT